MVFAVVRRLSILSIAAFLCSLSLSATPVRAQDDV